MSKGMGILRVRDFIVIAVAVVVVAVLVRTILRAPLVAEAFANGSSGPVTTPVNTVTECPVGSTMYMYDGHAYCCSSVINPDADTVTQTCRQTTGARVTFCTLGAPQPGVANCAQLRAGLLTEEGAAICPATAPHFVKGPAAAAGRCCAGNVNNEMTDCAAASAADCDVVADPNIFKYPRSCGYLRAKQDDACPTGFHDVDVTTRSGPLAGLTVYGCTDTKTTCYPPAVLDRLKALGYSTDGMPACA
jgi:hypothetical protein